MSDGRLLYDGELNAPTDPNANQVFHQVIIDRLMAWARDCGWGGARFHSYWREDGNVVISIAEGRTWPGLEQLRAEMHSIRVRPEPDDFDFQGDGQGRMFG